MTQFKLQPQVILIFTVNTGEQTFSRVSLFYEAYSLVTFYRSFLPAPVHVHGQPCLSFPLS